MPLPLLLTSLLTSLTVLNYTNNMRFETTVYKPDTYKELLVKVLRFDTEQYFDYMKIHDANGKTLALSSGLMMPYNLTTTSPSVRISFRSDETTTYEGIELEVFAF